LRTLNLLANLFPAWVLAGCLLALWKPELFAWFTPYLVPGLGVIMLGMGMTLSVGDFLAAAQIPRAILFGFAAQYSIMPSLGWLLARVLDLPPQFEVGLILVACCPGGTASNVVTYMARGNVALSVLMTTCSTLAAIVLTPLLTKWLVGQRMPVDAWGLFYSTVQVVLLPVAAGLTLHHAVPNAVRRVTPWAPLVSVVVIALICANVIGTHAAEVRAHGGELLLAAFLLHAGGFALGYAAARIGGYDVAVRRTISIEVGMQNSGLGAALASKHFADPTTGIALAAVPCAVSSVTHSLIGSALAAAWRLWPRPASSGDPGAEHGGAPRADDEAPSESDVAG